MNQLILTNDQSHSVLSERFQVTYHSVFGAIQESRHIFIHAALDEVLFDHDVIHVLEIGLGTGLNPLLTLLAADKAKRKVVYTAIEAYPLELELAKQLNYAELLDAPDDVLQKIHSCDWDTFHDLSENFSFRKIQTKLEDWTPDMMFDAIYFDAFSPDVQPELWTVEIFEKLFASLNPLGVLTTYSVKGVVKRALKTAGFLVEKLPGPPGKREMTRGKKEASVFGL